MKKTLIAMAALAAAGIASAQSSVTLFGVLDTSYESVKTNAGRISGLSNSANASSRWGMRGVEDLGGGMSAQFWLESAIGVPSGFGSSGTNRINQNAASAAGNVAAGGLTFNRRSTVALAGNFGEIRLGRDYAPSYWNYAVYDPFGNNSVGAALPSMTAVNMAATFVRVSNSIGYFLPANLGGIYGQAMYGFGNRSSIETTARPVAYGVTPVNTQDNGRYFGGRIGYANGPIDVAIAYGKTKYANGTNAGGGAAFATLANNFTGVGGDYTDMNLGGSYNFGTVKVMAAYARQKLANFNPTASAAIAGAFGDVTFKGWQLGADVGVGAGDILASWSTVKLDGVAGTPKGNKYALGYVHNLSKRTAVYAYLSHVTNKGGAAFDASSNSSGAIGSVTGPVGAANPNANGSSNGYDIGLRHSF